MDLLTKAAIREMILPSLLPVASPIVLFVIINWIAGKAEAFATLGAMLMGGDRHRPVRRHLDDLGRRRVG